MLPPYMRNAILESLCACNIVGFQTPRDAGNFLLTCQDLLPGAEVDYANRPCTSATTPCWCETTPSP